MKNQSNAIKVELQREIARRLLEAQNSSDFLPRAFEAIRSGGDGKRKINFAALARKMGFSSRSFVRQLAMGHKKPNLKNYRQIARGFGLSLEATEVFELMVERECLPSPPENLEKKFQEAQMKLRKTLLKKVRRLTNQDPVPWVQWPFVYASLGEQGRSFGDIVAMSGQSPSACARILDHLVVQRLVHLDARTQKYRAAEDMILLEEMTSSSVLRDLYQMIAMESLKRVESDLTSVHSMFHSSVFSVRSEDLPRLTRELQNLLSQYAAQAEDAKGSDLALLNASLIPMKRPRRRS